VYPLLGGVGITGISIAWLIIIYYAVLTAYALFFLGASIYSLKDINDPVWNGCKHYWNTELCKTTQDLENMIAQNITLTKSSYSMPTAEFWYNFVSEDDDDIRFFGYPNWKMVIALFVTWGIALGSICRGVNSIGKASYFFGIYPYFCITFLLFAGMFKDGAAQGILIYLIPKWEKLAELEVWADAGQQIFFSLSLCQGVMPTLSSFNDFHSPCLTNTLVVVVVNCVTSFWVGFPIFALLGHLAHSLGVPVDKVMDSGPGLTFVAYPQALSLLPGAAIWAIFFCSMIFSVGMGTLATLTETVVAFIIDALPNLRTKKKEMAFRCCFVLALFLLDLPMICSSGGMQLIDLVDAYCTGINSFIVGITMCFVLGYLYGMNKFVQDVSMMIGKRPNIYWVVTWRYLSPLFLVFMSVIWIVNKVQAHNPMPFWATNIGWTISISTMVVIPLYAFYVLCQHPAGLGCIAYRDLTKPNAKWGPLKNENRVGRYEKLSNNDASASA